MAAEIPNTQLRIVEIMKNWRELPEEKKRIFREESEKLMKIWAAEEKNQKKLDKILGRRKNFSNLKKNLEEIEEKPTVEERRRRFWERRNHLLWFRLRATQRKVKIFI